MVVVKQYSNRSKAKPCLVEACTESLERFSSEQVAAFRLTRHFLRRRADTGSLASVVSGVCGVQAQITSAAELALRARIEGLTREGLRVALEERRVLVKAWCMRGATHLLASAELPVHVGGLRGRLQREWSWIEKRGVSKAALDSMVEAIVDALADDEVLKRRELADRVVVRVGVGARRWVEHSWGGIVKQAGLMGLVMFGPCRGREITFARRDRWLPSAGELAVERAEEELLRRYLGGYGPASLTDFAA